MDSLVKVLEEAQRSVEFHRKSLIHAELNHEAIDQLLARIDALLKSGGWIPVDENSPALDEGEVLYLSTSNTVSTVHAANIRSAWNARMLKESCYYKAYQPLPPLPQEEGKSWKKR